MSFEISTEIEISASTAKVWGVLMNFEEYPKWNPFIKSIEGNPQVGKQIKANIDGMKFKPIVLTNEKNKEFKWIGKLLLKGLFDGEHRFQIEETEDGKVRFVQSEKFSGILVPFFKKKLSTDTKSGFEEMNRKLKEQAET